MAGLPSRILMGFVGPCLMAALVSTSSSASAAEEQRVPYYPAVRVGLTTEEFSPTGFWVDAGVLKEFSLSASFYATLEAALAASRDTTSNTLEYYEAGTEITSHNARFTLGVPLRAAIGVGRNAL